MAEANKLVTMLALVISGLLIAIAGAVYLWMHRKDQAVVEKLAEDGSITEADARSMSSSTWWWTLVIIQIIIGVALIIWGIFQYFWKAEDVYKQAKAGLQQAGTRLGQMNVSRRAPMSASAFASPVYSSDT